MTSYILVFIKDNKIVDKLNFNGPSHRFWELNVWENYKNRNSDSAKRVEKQYGKFDKGFNQLKMLDAVMPPIIRFWEGEFILRLYNEKEFKESNELAYVFIVVIMLIFFVFAFYKNALITVLFFAFCSIICLQSKPRKNWRSKSANIGIIILAFLLPIFLLSWIVSKCEIYNFSRYTRINY